VANEEALAEYPEWFQEAFHDFEDSLYYKTLGFFELIGWMLDGTGTDFGEGDRWYAAETTRIDMFDSFLDKRKRRIEQLRELRGKRP
jgi:hypothetical protein